MRTRKSLSTTKDELATTKWTKMAFFVDGQLHTWKKEKEEINVQYYCTMQNLIKGLGI